MKNNLYEMEDYVKTPDGKGYVNEDQNRRETTVLVELVDKDGKQVYDVDDVSLIASIS